MGHLNVLHMSICAALLVISVNIAEGQKITTPCTSSMISNFTQCANFITGSRSKGPKPSATCCDAVRSLMSTSMDCACLLISANVPLPFNRTLSLSLPRACNMDGVPVQCKASATPLPAPGPAVLGPNAPSLPALAASPAPLSRRVSEATLKLNATKPEALELAASPAEAPTRTPKIRPVLVPSHQSNNASYVLIPRFVFIVIGIMLGVSTY